ncbi:MAG: alpha/beta fold hydrolase [Polyangiaceae bacterium]
MTRALTLALALAACGACVGCSDEPAGTPAPPPSARSASSASASAALATSAPPRGSSGPLPARSVGAEVETALHTRARSLAEALGRNDYATFTKSYDDDMQKSLPEPQLRAMWEALTSRVGALEKVDSTHEEQFGAYRVIVVRSKFKTTSLDLKLSFDKKDRLTGFFAAAIEEYEAPPYARADAFEERVVVIDAAGTPLPGVITAPKSTDKVAGIVLVPDAGPQDLDETIGANKPFWDLAQGLASEGFAVLRFDKRTLADPSASASANFTVEEELVADAAAAVATLAREANVDPKRIVVVGHGLGGRVAPRIAKRGGVAGVALLAPRARPLADAELASVKYLANLDGHVAPDEDDAIHAAEAQATLALALGDGREVNGRALGYGAAYWKDLASFDAPAAARALELPLFVAFGGRDYEVTKEDAAIYDKALAGAAGAVVRTYADANHLLMPGGGPSNPEEYRQASHVSQDLVKDLAEWVRSIKSS